MAEEYQCMNRICINYKTPHIPKKANPWTENALDCHNCNVPLKKVKLKR